MSPCQRWVWKAGSKFWLCPHLRAFTTCKHLGKSFFRAAWQKQAKKLIRKWKKRRNLTKIKVLFSLWRQSYIFEMPSNYNEIFASSLHNEGNRHKTWGLTAASELQNEMTIMDQGSCTRGLCQSPQVFGPAEPK
jgi:hypothetical protein